MRAMLMVIMTRDTGKVRVLGPRTRRIIMTSRYEIFSFLVELQT